jgi:hypothetical protein
VENITQKRWRRSALPRAMEGRLGGYRGGSNGKMYVCILGNEIFGV